MKLLSAFAASLTILLLAGCSAAIRQGDESREVIESLANYGRLATLPAEEQLVEYEAAQAEFQKQQDDARRLRLALALSLPYVTWRDDAQVQKLLEILIATPAGQASPRRDLALLIQRLVAERQRLLREEQRKAEAAQAKLQALATERQRQLQIERDKAAELQGKLDALIAIDREPRRRSHLR